MRSSCRKGDPGYPPKIWPAIILLDGKRVKNCITADEELGMVECYVISEQTGDKVIAFDRSGALTFKMYGAVTIIPKTR